VDCIHSESGFETASEKLGLPVCVTYFSHTESEVLDFIAFFALAWSLHMFSGQPDIARDPSWT